MKLLLAAACLLAASSMQAQAQTCSAAYAKCEKNALQLANNKGDSIGWCAKSKSVCMEKGVFPATKYTGRMSGLQKK